MYSQEGISHVVKIQRQKALYRHRRRHTGHRARLHFLCQYEHRPAAEHGSALRGRIYDLCGRDAGTGGERYNAANGGFVRHALRHQRHHFHLCGEPFHHHHGIRERRGHERRDDRAFFTDRHAARLVERLGGRAGGDADQPGHAAGVHRLRVPGRRGRAGAYRLCG